MKQYYFVCENKDFFLGKNLHESSENDFAATLIKERYTINNTFLKKINKLHTSKSINAKVTLPFRSVWKAYDNVEKCVGKDSVFIFYDNSIQKFTVKELRGFKAKGAHLYILFLNPTCRPSARYGLRLYEENRDLFETVYTIDKKDSIQYNWEYTDQVYYRNKQNSFGQKWDLFFVGRAKDRLPLLHTIYKMVRSCSLKFYIADVPEKNQIQDSGIVYNKFLKYDEVLNILFESNCILEVVQGVQNGYTYRYYEAICYNKKLLTNNKMVLSSPFYDSKFIQYFEHASDIDVDFLTRKTYVNYNYNDEYSPNRIVEKIMRKENDASSIPNGEEKEHL